MIALASYLALLGVSLLVICTPGQDTALTVRNTLLGTRCDGMATAAGVSAGQAVSTLATAAGLATVLRAWAPLFGAVRRAIDGLVGAVLVSLGVRVAAATLSGAA